MERFPSHEELIKRDQRLEIGLEILVRGHGQIDENNVEELMGLPHSGDGLMQDIIDFFNTDEHLPVGENSVWNALNSLAIRGIASYRYRGAKSDYDRNKILTHISLIEE